MSPDLLEQALRVFCRRRPFRAFHVEFNSGGCLVVSHPEGVRREGPLFVGRSRKGHYEVFAAESVSRLLDPPTESSAD